MVRFFGLCRPWHLSVTDGVKNSDGRVLRGMAPTSEDHLPTRQRTTSRVPNGRCHTPRGRALGHGMFRRGRRCSFTTGAGRVEHLNVAIRTWNYGCERYVL